MYALSRKDAANTNSGLIWGVGTVLGPVVGGGFELVTWRWAFWINLIIGGIWGPIYVTSSCFHHLTHKRELRSASEPQSSTTWVWSSALLVSSA
jgi:MFS family permease